MKTKYIIATVAILIAIGWGAMLSKPSDEETIKQATQVVSKGLFGAAPDVYNAAGGGMAERIISNGITIEDHILFNEAIFTWGGKARTLGYGYFGGFHASN